MLPQFATALGHILGHNTFIERHGDSWRFRVRMPAGLARLSVRKELRVSLGPIPHAVAIARARTLRVEADRLFEGLSRMKDVEEAQAAIEAWRAAMLAHFATKMLQHGLLVLEPGEIVTGASGVGDATAFGIDILLRAAAGQRPDVAVTTVKRALSGDPIARRQLQPVVEAGLKATGIASDCPPDRVALLTTRILQAHLALQQDLIAIGRGDPDAIAAALAPHQAHGGNTGQAAPAQVVAAPELSTVVTMPPAAGSEPLSRHPSFEEQWASFIEDMLVTTRQWKPSRRPELLATGRLWTWIVGKSADQSGPVDLARLRDIYLVLPTGYDRKKNYAQRRPEEIIAEAKALALAKKKAEDIHRTRMSSEGARPKADPDYPRVSPKTFNKHLSTLKTFWNWLGTRGQLAKGAKEDFKGFHVNVVKRGKHGRDEREMYQLDQIETLFKGPIWTGHESRHVRTRPGGIVVRDTLYWVPLMCAFHGMRREEACQLRVRHIEEIAGIWTIDLTAPDLSLKEEGGEEGTGSPRLIPLHREFLALGFIDALVTGRDGESQLFKDLSNDNSHASFGEAVGKRFSYYQKTAHPGMPRGLHRFRHTFSTTLENTSAKSAFIDELTGHSSADRSSERKRYTKAIYIENLKRTIDMLRLPIDVDLLNKAAAGTSHRD